MLIFGHRGAKGLKPENTIASIREAVMLGVDAVEFDIHLTKDKVPILIHDKSLLRTHQKFTIVSRTNYKDLLSITESGEKRITSLEEVLDEFFGVIMLNIEIKRYRAVKVVMELLKKKYVKSQKDWGKIYISSFKPSILMVVRRMNKLVKIFLLHAQNPFLFIAFARIFKLNGVGFYNLSVNNFALEIAKKTGLFTYVYTVNSIEAARILENKGLDAIVTNFPDRFIDYPRS